MALFNSWSWQIFMFYTRWVVSLLRFMSMDPPRWDWGRPSQGKWRCVNLWRASGPNDIATKLQSLNVREFPT